MVGLASSSGALQRSYDYEPFGETRAEVTLDPLAPDNPMGFTAALLDEGTGMYHLRARDYDPSLGRFSATDPLAPDIADPYVSAYVYADDRPTVLVDPSGMRGETPDRVLPTTPISTVQEPWTAFRHFISQLEIINSLSSSNDSFVRTAAQRLGGYDAGRFGIVPTGLPEGLSRQAVPYEITGSSGWRADLTDDDGDVGSSPARHFIGILAAGYFHRHIADDQLKVNEAPGRGGASLQDRRSGEIAIELGMKLRRGQTTRLTLIFEIGRRAGSPDNGFDGNRPSENVGDDPPLVCYIGAPC
jgi:RHS repeat-associated protein